MSPSLQQPCKGSKATYVECCYYKVININLTVYCCLQDKYCHVLAVVGQIHKQNPPMRAGSFESSAKLKIICFLPLSSRTAKKKSSTIYKRLPSERRLCVAKCKSNSLKLRFVPAFYQAAELLARQPEHKLLTLTFFLCYAPCYQCQM